MTLPRLITVMIIAAFHCSALVWKACTFKADSCKVELIPVKPMPEQVLAL